MLKTAIPEFPRALQAHISTGPELSAHQNRANLRGLHADVLSGPGLDIAPLPASFTSLGQGLTAEVWYSRRDQAGSSMFETTAKPGYLSHGSPTGTGNLPQT